jgi:hypothetical protein
VVAATSVFLVVGLCVWQSWGHSMLCPANMLGYLLAIGRWPSDRCLGVRIAEAWALCPEHTCRISFRLLIDTPAE